MWVRACIYACHSSPILHTIHSVWNALRSCTDADDAPAAFAAMSCALATCTSMFLCSFSFACFVRLMMWNACYFYLPFLLRFFNSSLRLHCRCCSNQKDLNHFIYVWLATVCGCDNLTECVKYILTTKCTIKWALRRFIVSQTDSNDWVIYTVKCIKLVS